ncbi:MFS general substrate transporter [Fistulina hepatica ATCC 64428]|nr:MFS general substrate transporter [Fistulina hepatica ATCC 64428]
MPGTEKLGTVERIEHVESSPSDIVRWKRANSRDTVEKQSVEQLERAVPSTNAAEWEGPHFVDAEPPVPTFWGHFLKQNPSPQFIADITKMAESPLDPVMVKRLERRIDIMIMPALAICYMFYYVDKTTLSYAAIFGLEKDLKLTGDEYNWLSSLFYFGWLAWALPTNLLMQKFPLNKYLAVNIFVWGLLLMCQAASRNFVDLAVLRTLSGAAEATADPAFVLITAMWYSRAQQPRRIGYWYCANGGGIALGGLLGYAIGHIGGALAAWQYEFLIIGALCTIWSVVLFYSVPDSPYLSKRFSRTERLVILARKKDDHHGAEHRQWDPSQALEAFVDPKTYLFFLFGFTANVPNGGTSNFGTLIVNGFGFNEFQTTLMQIPYGVIIVLFIVVAMFGNERMPKNSRTIMMVLTNIPTVVGFALIAFVNNRGVQLFGYWITGASNATFVVGLSLVSGNVGGQTKKAIASAAVFLGVAAGNITGPFLFFASQAPTYRTGIIACLCSRALEIVIIIIFRFLFMWCNHKRDKRDAEGVNYDVNELAAQDLSDWKNPAFRYVYVSLAFLILNQKIY